MAFTLDREEAARRLGVSSRTIDRHIQAGRIRTRRIGKKMFLEDADIESIRLADPSRREEDYVVITDKKSEVSSHDMQSSTAIVSRGQQAALTELVRLYEESQSLIARKDATIQDLSYKLGKAETELANSIPAMEYKKATFMLESAKTKSDADTQILNSEISRLRTDVSKRNSALITLVILFILVLGFAIMFVIFDGTFW